MFKNQSPVSLIVELLGLFIAVAACIAAVVVVPEVRDFLHLDDEIAVTPANSSSQTASPEATTTPSATSVSQPGYGHVATKAATQDAITPLDTLRIFDLHFCDRPCSEDEAQFVEQYPEHVGEVYVIWGYQGMRQGAKYSRVWSSNGREWVRYDCTWQGPENGTFSVKLWDKQGLCSGVWTMVILVEGQQVIESSIEVAGSYDYFEPAGILPCPDW